MPPGIASDAPPAHRRGPAKKVKPTLEPIPGALGPGGVVVPAASASAPQASSADGDCSFARALASPDPATRTRGLSALALWLTARPDVSEADMRKVWERRRE